MIQFEELFVKAKGQPIVVAGITYCMMIRMNVASGDVLHILIDKLIQHPKQGIRFDSDKPIVVNGKIDNAHSCWLAVAPSELVVECPKECCLVIRNIWDNGDGVEQSWHAGGAMTETEVDGCKYVKCNSTLENDAMSDLVFRVYRISSQALTSRK